MDRIHSCHKRAASCPGLLSSGPILSRPFLLPLSSAEDSLIIKCTHHPTPMCPSEGLLPAEPVTAEELTAFSYHVGVSVHSGEAFVGSRALAMYAFAVILKLQRTSGSLLKQTTGPRPRLSVSLRWSLRTCSSNKFPGDADVSSPLLPAPFMPELIALQLVHLPLDPNHSHCGTKMSLHFPNHFAVKGRIVQANRSLKKNKIMV